MLTDSQKRLVDRLFAIGAIQTEGGTFKGGFKLKRHQRDEDLPPSPYFANLRTEDNPKRGPLTAGDVEDVAWQLFALASELDLGYDLVAGLPNAGDPFAREFVHKAKTVKKNVRLVTFAKEDEGAARYISGVKSGDFSTGERLLFIDDVCTEADTKIEGLEQAAKLGLKVTDIMVILDREEGGADELMKRGVRLHAILPVSTLMVYATDAGKITPEKWQEVVRYLGLPYLK